MFDSDIFDEFIFDTGDAVEVPPGPFQRVVFASVDQVTFKDRGTSRDGQRLFPRFGGKRR